jgi:hypothetical protein
MLAMSATQWADPIDRSTSVLFCRIATAAPWAEELAFSAAHAVHLPSAAIWQGAGAPIGGR